MEPDLGKPYHIIAFDWDGTAVESRYHDAGAVKAVIEPLLSVGVRCVIITGTNFGNIDRQFCSIVNPALRHNLYACTNRGSEVFGFDNSGKTMCLYRREAEPWENRVMDQVSISIRDQLYNDYGLTIEIIFDRLNRRKLDLIPLPEWADPPKTRIGELLVVVEDRLRNHGLDGGIASVMKMAEERSELWGLDARITTDVKHVEIGLTDKSDSVRYIIDQIARPAGLEASHIMFIGDEFGPIAGFEGSDFKMVTDYAYNSGSLYVSVGTEPNGVPPEVFHYGKGVKGFEYILLRQVEAHRRK